MSYYPPVILSAGRINGGMGNFIAAKTVKMLTWMFNSSVISVPSVVENAESDLRILAIFSLTDLDQLDERTRKVRG